MKVFLIGHKADTELFRPAFLKLGMGKIVGRKPYFLAYFFHELVNLQDSIEKHKDGNGEYRYFANKGLCFTSLEEAQQYCKDQALPSSGKTIPKSAKYKNPAPTDIAQIIYELEVPDALSTTINHPDYPESMRLSQQLINNATLISISFCDKRYNLNREVKDFPNFSLDEFKIAYKKQYDKEHTLFKNPWSKMKTTINQNKLSSMAEVYEYACLHPKTRTAMVLQSMFAKSKVFLELAENFSNMHFGETKVLRPKGG